MSIKKINDHPNKSIMIYTRYIGLSKYSLLITWDELDYYSKYKKISLENRW